jgi:glyoxylase-like metal-dependent hydrolase (beta-lactamase superfamily II)
MKSSSQLLVAVLVFLFTAPVLADEPLPFEVTRLTDKVLIFTELSPWRSNHVVVNTDRGLVLVDPGGSPAIARLLRQAISTELGHAQIAYIVNHHHHWGHSWGNVAFPEAIVIGHEDSVDLMTTTAPFVEPRLNRFRTQLDEATAQLAELEEGSPEAVAAQERLAQAEWMIAGLTELGFTVRPPDVTFSERIVLDLGNVTLELHALGNGHSATDTVMLIPEERVLLTGCFFFVRDGLPEFGFHPELEVDRWREVFAAVLDGDAPVEHVVPGQHALWSPDQLRGWRDYIADLWDDVQQLEADGVTLAVAEERLPPSPELRSLADDSVDDARLAEYQRANVEKYWRQHKERAAAVVERTLDEQGLDAALATHRGLRELPEGEVYFSEVEYNVLGYRVLGDQRYAEAIAIFELNVEMYPESWNVYDSLGEAHMLAGDDQRAIELYRKSLEINPDNANGVAMLQRLGVEP